MRPRARPLAALAAAIALPLAAAGCGTAWQEVDGWTVEDGPFAAAARAEEAPLRPSEWTRVRCTYLVNVRWRQGLL